MVTAGTGEALPGPIIPRSGVLGSGWSYNRRRSGSGLVPGGRRRRPYYRLSARDNRTRREGRAAASFMRHAQGRAGECHIVARTAKQDQVRELQRTLYRAAKADPGRRFHALYDKVYRTDVLERAWELVRANRGAAGIDNQTIADVEEYGITKLLDGLAVDLRDGSWRPLPARRVFIPKPGRKELRPLSIPAVCDRVVQAAIKIVIEPIFGKRRTTGMREGNGRVLHRRPSESRWPRVMRWRPARAQRSVHRGARRPVIEPRNGSDIGVPTRSKTSEGNTAGGVFASRPRTPRGLRTRHVCDLSMLRTGRSHGHPPVVMEGRVVRGRPRP